MMDSQALDPCRIQSDSCGRKSGCLEETNTEEPVRHKSTYITNYRLVDYLLELRVTSKLSKTKQTILTKLELKWLLTSEAINVSKQVYISKI